MTQEEIAVLAGHRIVSPWVMKLAMDVAKAEREACALACFDYSCKKEGWPSYQKAADECEQAIRARGEA